VVVFLLAPIAIVFVFALNPTPYIQFPPVGVSLRWFEKFFASRDFMNALWLSLEVAAMTTIAATLFGASAALALARGGLPGARVITAIMLSPLMLPAILTGLALFQSYVLLDVGRPALGTGARPYAGVDPLCGAHDAGGSAKLRYPPGRSLRATSAPVPCAPISR
jgi:putative spermidine/putrescine transport system permease protein